MNPREQSERILNILQAVRHAGRVLGGQRNALFSPASVQALCDLLALKADLAHAGRQYGVTVGPLLAWIHAVDGTPEGQRFNMRGWPAALAVLDELGDAIASAAEQPVANVESKPAADMLVNTPRAGIREPSKDAMAAYRASIATGKRQSDIAALLTRELKRHIGQATVSRWIGNVKGWLQAGNVLPDLSPLAKLVPMDPVKLDMGARTDRRTARQHAPRSADD